MGNNPEAIGDFFENACGSHLGFGSQWNSGTEQAQIVVDLRNIMTGADRTIGLQMPQTAGRGRVTMHDKCDKVHLPTGILPSQKWTKAASKGAWFAEHNSLRFVRRSVDCQSTAEDQRRTGAV